MEQPTIDKINEIIRNHQTEIPHYSTGNQAEQINGILNFYKVKCTEEIAKRKSLIEDVLVYFRSVSMISETIGLAGTHAEKAARLRGLIELLNSAIAKLRDGQTDQILTNWNYFDWSYSDYPYKSILEKYSQLKRENDELKNIPSSGVEPSPLPF